MSKNYICGFIYNIGVMQKRGKRALFNGYFCTIDGDKAI